MTLVKHQHHAVCLDDNSHARCYCGEIMSDHDWCPVCAAFTVYDGGTCTVCGRVWGIDFDLPADGNITPEWTV